MLEVEKFRTQFDALSHVGYEVLSEYDYIAATMHLIEPKISCNIAAPLPQM